MEENPLISIVIPVYNRENLIIETLKSVQHQTYSHWECIVVDDGSTDGTQKVVQEYVEKDHRFRFFQRDREPKGAPTCRNIGLENSEGEYIIFLDSDDLLKSICVEKRLMIISQSKNNFEVFKTLKFYQNINDFNETFNKETSCALRSFLRYDLPWQTSSVIWSKKSLVKLKGFDESFMRLQDVDLHTRALIMGMHFSTNYYLEADSYYRVEEKSIIAKVSSCDILKSLNFFYNMVSDKLNIYNYRGELRVFYWRFFVNYIIMIRGYSSERNCIINHPITYMLYNYNERKMIKVLSLLSNSYFMKLNFFKKILWKMSLKLKVV